MFHGFQPFVSDTEPTLFEQFCGHSINSYKSIGYRHFGMPECPNLRAVFPLFGTEAGDDSDHPAARSKSNYEQRCEHRDQ